MSPRRTSPLTHGGAVAFSAPVVEATLGLTRAMAAPCPPRTTAQIVCSDDRWCVCPLGGRLTDRERAVMDDLSRSASRLSTAFAWIFALMGLTAMIMLMIN